MSKNPYPVIFTYLSKQPPETFGIKGARITHIYCNNITDAEDVARCSLIPNIVVKPEDMIGKVDAVICATDIGSEHVKRCQSFMEADIPMFIDKPMTDNEKDLRTFVKWYDEGKHFLSSSSMRYVKSMEPFYKNHYEIGRLMYVCKPMCKKWETYGIHALEEVFPLLGEGFVSIQNTGSFDRNMIHMIHTSGCDVHIPLSAGMYGAFGCTMLIGSEGNKIITDSDSYYSFKKQNEVFIDYLRTGERPYPFSETIELAKLVIGGIRSREEKGRRVLLLEISER
jgi:predicted dehydrogenase